MSLPAYEKPRVFQIRSQIAALENERDAESLIDTLAYLATHVAIVADASARASGSQLKDSLAAVAADLAHRLADRIDAMPRPEGGAA